jgi:competence protein ComEC
VRSRGRRGNTGLDLRLVAPATACWVAAGVLIGFPGWAAPTAVLLWTGALTAIPAALSSRRTRWRGTWSLVGVCCAAGGLCASVLVVAEPLRSPAIVRNAVESHDGVRGTLTVASAPTRASSFGGTSDRVRFSATLTSLMGPPSDRSAPVSVPVIVYADLPADAVAPRIGSVVELSGSLRASAAGSAAAAEFLGRGPPAETAGPPWWLGWASELRAGFSRASGALPGDGGDLLPGLAIGDTSAVGAPLDTAMKASSLSHLTAVSGANCVIVVAAIMLLGAALGVRRGLRIGLALFALTGFVVLVTPEASVLRAAVMAAIVMISIGLGRPGRGVPALSLAVIVLLVGDPWLSREYGFTLSVLATAGLLVLSGPLTIALGRWMPVPLAAALAVPLAAQLACQPVLVLLSPSLPLYGVPANMLAAPAAPAATVIGLAACLLLPWLPGIATACLHLAWIPSAWIAATAQATSNLPASRLPWWGGLLGMLLLGAGTLLLLVVVLRAGAPSRSRWPAGALALLLLFSGSYSGVVIGSGIGRALTFPPDWQLAACDIGQGDAVVVRDGDAVALIDVGPEPVRLTRCLRTLGISHVDLLVLTHYDLDHVGGVDAVVGMVDTALVGVPVNEQDERLHQRLAWNGAAVRVASRGDRGTLGGLRWEVLWPRRGTAGIPSGLQTGNAGSVTVAFDGAGIRSLFLGDLGEESQRALQAASPLGTVDVVKVAHHGSGDQSPGLYAALQAKVGLVSVGADNGYGHPTAKLLDILQSTSTATFRTDIQGMLVIAPGPRERAGRGVLTVWTEHPQ